MPRNGAALALAAGAALVAMMAGGCASEPGSTPSNRADLVVAELRSEISENRLAAALGRIDGLRRGSVVPQEDLDAVQAEAVERMAAALSDALENGETSEAIRLYRNLEVLGEQVPSEPASRDVSLNDLYVRLAREYEEAGNGPAALAEALRIPELSSLPVETLEELAAGAVALNNRYTAGIVAEVLGNHWVAENPEFQEFLAGATSPIDAATSTVTVWVNRGIRLEGGVGYPDRVIGSGFFIDPRGYLITNHHVIESEVDPEYEGYSRLFIRLPENPDARIPARVVGWDKVFDVALLKVELDAPYVLSFTDIRSLDPGTRIIAIGSPGGLENTITSGIISATGRRFLQMGDAMQVDVPINPGSSGGPLLDERGNLVGVVFAGIEQFEGVNFAIPSYWIQHFLPDLYTAGAVVHPWIGASVATVSRGLELSYIIAESPAERSGLQVGDVITHIGPWEVKSISSAQRSILAHSPGSLVQVTWLRDGESDTGLLALAERPDSPVEQALEDDVHERLYPVLYGMRVRREGESMLNRRYRVERVYAGSIADETGITAGDSFTERDFDIDEELGLALLRIVVRKRTEGFMQTGIQLPAWLETDSFL